MINEKLFNEICDSYGVAWEETPAGLVLSDMHTQREISYTEFMEGFSLTEVTEGFSLHVFKSNPQNRNVFGLDDSVFLFCGLPPAC